LFSPKAEVLMLVHKIAILLKVLLYVALYVQSKCSSSVLAVSYFAINAAILSRYFPRLLVPRISIENAAGGCCLEKIQFCNVILSLKRDENFKTQETKDTRLLLVTVNSGRTSAGRK
jgi:hypothetical protein